MLRQLLQQLNTDKIHIASNFTDTINVSDYTKCNVCSDGPGGTGKHYISLLNSVLQAVGL